jgi:predicted enzyme related to lactoylglutathione lyase/catechol 2,3-dioxygenase-like lactoylglutathione lyase family enzyme
MAEIQHLAICTKNNRRLARFYQLIFELEESWNRFQNSPYAFYMSDGYLNLNCLQIRPGSSYNRIVDGQEIMPDVGINHIGFTVKSVKDIEQRLSSLNPPVKLVASPQDGRYEEWRITDPDGTIFEIAEGGWEAGGPERLPAIRYVGIRSEDPERLASFYKSALPISEVNRVTDPTGEARAIFLSAGKTALGLLKKTSASKNGFERVGFQVGSIDEIKKRLRNAPPYLYPGEPEVSVMMAPSGDPGKSLYLKDPDGNIVALSDEGWIA